MLPAFEVMMPVDVEKNQNRAMIIAVLKMKILLVPVN